LISYLFIQQLPPYLKALPPLNACHTEEIGIAVQPRT
jgi:hypothetical protein